MNVGPASTNKSAGHALSGDNSARSLSRSAVGERFLAMLQRLREAMKFQVPLGYEDERGFHYGAEPVRVQVDR